MLVQLSMGIEMKVAMRVEQMIVSSVEHNFPPEETAIHDDPAPI